MAHFPTPHGSLTWSLYHRSSSHSYRALDLPLKMRTFLTLRPPSPCLSSSFTPPPSSSSSSSSFLFTFRPHRRCFHFHFLSPSSSLRQTKKQQTLQKTSAPPNAPPPQSLKWLFSSSKKDDKNGAGDSDSDGGLEGDTAVKGTLLAGLLLVGVVGGFAAVGYFYKDQINAFLNQLSTFIEGRVLIWGPNSSYFHMILL